ncbi:hypothetical protein [Halovulum sp. GXIMD14793]
MVARLLTLIFGLALLGAAPARAEFGDCMNRDYLSAFGSSEARSAPLGPIQDITCVVEFEYEFPTPTGLRRVRGIRDINADWAFRPGSLGEVEHGARRTTETMQTLGGGWAIDDITILILDNTYEPAELDAEHEGTIGAITAPTRDWDHGKECLVTTYMLGRGGEVDVVAAVLAHELFHCLQVASLSAGQVATMAGGGAWWAEGSAEYFSALAVPTSPFPAMRTGAFDEAVGAETPFHNMSYEMAVFFYWFHGQDGPTGLMPFLRGMASSNGTTAQRAAMRGALSDDKWLMFTQDYADRAITAPGGSALPFADNDGDEISFTGNRTERFTLSPFVIWRGWVTYDCGMWENKLRPDNANIGGRLEREREWSSYPEEVDSEEAPEIRVRYAALNTGDNDQAVRLKVERKRSCEPCAGAKELDACVVGTWEMTGGGPIEWMKRQGINIPASNPGTRIMHLADDGTYYTNPFGTSITVQAGDEVSYGEGSALPAAGRWSIADGKLAICQDSGGVQGTVTVQGRTMPVGQPGGGTLIHSYSCGRTSMSATHNAAGSPMETTYTRLSPPPEED